MPDTALMPLFSLVEPLHEYHCGFLRDVETRLATWEGRSNAHLNGDYRRIGDVLLKNMGVLSVSTLHLFHFCTRYEPLRTNLLVVTIFPCFARKVMRLVPCLFVFFLLRML